MSRTRKPMPRTRARMTDEAHCAVGLDELTGAWNYSGFIAVAAPIFLSCTRRDAPFALAYFDFHTNDVTVPDGPEGVIDGALISMAKLMRKAFRACDVIGRVGSSRLAVLLSDCTDEALASAEGVRAVADMGSPTGLSLTVGMVRGASSATLDELMREADARVDELRRGRIAA
jgi:GGDEF domain-containing protein